MYGENLREIREEKELKQAEIAKILEMDKACYSQYEREYQIVPIKHLNTLCNFYDISLDYIFSFTNIKQYENNKKDIDTKLISERLKEIRKENKLTQIKFAKILNIGNGTIANYETGRYLIATPFLYTICKKYNISADYLLGRIDNPKYLN